MMYKCKEFAFGMIFSVLFLLGVLVGVLLFRYALEPNMDWLQAYGQEIFSDTGLSVRNMAFSILRPILCLLLLAMVPWGVRILPACIVIRGLMSSYLACACYMSGITPMYGLLHGVLQLPVFYAVCRWICLGRTTRCVRSFQSGT